MKARKNLRNPHSPTEEISIHHFNEVCMSAIFRSGLFIFLFSFALGCSGPDQTSSEQTTPPSPPQIAQEAPPVPQVQTPPDTVDATVRRPAEPIATPPPPEVPQTLPRPPVVPRFGVQIGAYTQPDVAQRIATLAKSRFPVKLQQILDRNSEMTKIYLGEFSSKDDARKFRDTIVRQFPGEYDDAWVSEIPQQ
jgi:hypothetical protein